MENPEPESDFEVVETYTSAESTEDGSESEAVDIVTHDFEGEKQHLLPKTASPDTSESEDDSLLAPGSWPITADNDILPKLSSRTVRRLKVFIAILIVFLLMVKVTALGLALFSGTHTGTYSPHAGKKLGCGGLPVPDWDNTGHDDKGYYQYRINRDHHGKGWMYRSHAEEPDSNFDVTTKFLGLSGSSSGDGRTGVKRINQMSASVYFDFPYKRVRASENCTNAFNEMITRPFNEGCDVPFRAFQDPRNAKEPLYVWHGRHPCSTECKKKILEGLYKVRDACADEDINFSLYKEAYKDGMDGQCRVRTKMDKVTLLDLAEKVREQSVESCFGFLWNKRKAVNEDPPRVRTLEGFFEATRQNFRSRQDNFTAARFECTEHTKGWLRGLIYRWKDEATDGRMERYFQRVSHAIDLCGDSANRYLFNKAIYWFVRDGWEDKPSSSIGEILTRGIMPGDFPLKDLRDALKNAKISIGMNTYESLLLSNSSCYPFLSKSDYEDKIKPNPLLETAYCDLNCPDGFPSDLQEAILHDAGTYDRKWVQDPYNPGRWIEEEQLVDQDVADVLNKMWDRLLFWHKKCHLRKGRHDILYAFTDPESDYNSLDKAPPLKQYVDRTLKVITRILYANPEIALNAYREPHSGGQDQQQKTLHADPVNTEPEADAIKKQLVCNKVTRNAIDMTFKLNPLNPKVYWWQRVGTEFSTWEIYREYVLKMFGIVERYLDYCGEQGLGEWKKGINWRRLDEMLDNDKSRWHYQRSHDTHKARLENTRGLIRDTAAHPKKVARGSFETNTIILGEEEVGEHEISEVIIACPL